MLQYPSAWLQNASLGETIACELRLRIINGTIKTGETISENWVASEFGTSRSPVREALKTLSSEGLIRLERMGKPSWSVWMSRMSKSCTTFVF